MPVTSQLGYIEVPKSITNPNVSRSFALDVSEPMSFLLFIKTINVDYDPEPLQRYYTEYLKKWNLITNNKQTTEDDLIKERYLEFIKDISINYTTVEEKKFLSQMDFNDPYDLEAVLGLYSKKLVEVCNYYKTKREDLKLEVARKKLKGTNFGTTKTINDLVIEYLENVPERKLLYDIEKIKSNFTTEIVELYDTYPKYLNQPPDCQIYDYKDFDFGLDLFLRTTTDILTSNFADVSKDLADLKELDSMIDNKRLLTEKYMYTDYYYLSTGSTVTEFISGKLFDASNPSKNIRNREHPTTASTPKSVFETSRERGFFKPHKTSVVFLEGDVKSFNINFDALEPNQIYYFPDPLIMGDDGGVITFTIDDEFLKKNFSHGNSKNQPLNTPKSNNSYYGYVTKEEKNESRYLDKIFDNGYVQDSKTDVYGNLYGVFKISDHYNQNVVYDIPTQIKSLLLNGGYFFDELFGEGYNFDYSIYDTTTYNETIRSSLTSFSNGFSAMSPYLLFFRNFIPYEELIEPTETALTKTYVIRDGGPLTKPDLSLYDDPISSDLSAFPGGYSYYYNTLYEGGIATSTPLQRALLDPSFPSLTANLTESVRPSGNNDVILVDGGLLTEEFTFDFSFENPEYEYIGDNINNTIITDNDKILEYLNERSDLNGSIMIRNGTDRTVKPLLQAIPHLQTKHSSAIVSQLSSGVKNFDLLYDTLFVQTSSYLVIDQILFEGGSYVDNGSNTIQIEYNSNDFEKISNRFNVGTKVYYAVLETDQYPVSSNNFKIYPKIYQYDVAENKNKLIFPKNSDIITTFYSCSGDNIRYVTTGTPTLTDNTRNERFNVSFMLKDQNEYFQLHDYDFELKPNVQFLSHNIYKPNALSNSNIMTSSYDSNLTVYMSSVSTTNISDVLIV